MEMEILISGIFVVDTSGKKVLFEITQDCEILGSKDVAFKRCKRKHIELYECEVFILSNSLYIFTCFNFLSIL